MPTVKILLTGASGAVGSCVLEQLLQQNFDVSVLDQKTPASQKVLQPFHKARFFWGDIRDKALVKVACQDQDVVIHLAAIIPPLADLKPELAYSVNVEGTRNIVNALETSSKPVFLFYSSSVSVYGDRLKNPEIKTSDPLSPSLGDEYAKTKIQAEQIIQSSKLDWSIFRLSAIFGVGNHKLSAAMFHMPLATAIEFTTPEDAARAFVNAISKRGQLNKQIFNLGGGNMCRTSYKEFLQCNFQIAGLGRLQFPEHAFAEKNFHCGYYQDGDVLENLLSFRKDSLESYVQKLKASISPLQRFATRMISPFFKRYLLSQSEPLQAIKERDPELLKRFFTEATLQTLS